MNCAFWFQREGKSDIYLGERTYSRDLQAKIIQKKEATYENI